MCSFALSSLVGSFLFDFLCVLCFYMSCFSLCLTVLFGLIVGGFLWLLWFMDFCLDCRHVVFLCVSSLFVALCCFYFGLLLLLLLFLCRSFFGAFLLSVCLFA